MLAGSVGKAKLAAACCIRQAACAARQLADGGWTSKLGQSVRIEHATLDALTGEAYGVSLKSNCYGGNNLSRSA